MNSNLENYCVISDNLELEFSSNNNTNKLINNLINESIIQPINDLIENNNNNNSDNNETIIEIPIKKKKGRKSKKIKELELGQEKPIEPVRRFPKLSEKIFDVLLINEIEYYYDTDFNLLLDKNVEPIGFKDNNKFIFYSESNDTNNQIKEDNREVKLIYCNYKNNK